IMRKDRMDELFEGLQGQFDLEVPGEGHRERFMEKMERNRGALPLGQRKTSPWKTVSIAASVALVALLGQQILWPRPSLEQKLVQLAPEVGRSETYFANLIEHRVKELKADRTPDTARLVDDALGQLKRMEQDYRQLELDLLGGGDSKLIIGAMINNFQTRIDLLKEVSLQMENIKNLNSQQNES